MNEWVWSNGGMILTVENWSTGRKTLYSVGGRWMNEYGAMVEWYWQGKLKYGEKNVSQRHFVHIRIVNIEAYNYLGDVQYKITYWNDWNKKSILILEFKTFASQIKISTKSSELCKIQSKYIGNISILDFLRGFVPTDWIRMVLEKLTVPQPVNKFTAFCWTWQFITSFTRDSNLLLSSARGTQFTSSHSTSFRSFSIFHPINA